FVPHMNLTPYPDNEFADVNYLSEEVRRNGVARANAERGGLRISTVAATRGVVRLERTERALSILVSVAGIQPVEYRMPDYLYRAVTSPVMQEEMKWTGTGMPHIHLTALRAVPIPLAPLAEQAEVIKIVEQRLASMRGAGDAVAM